MLKKIIASSVIIIIIIVIIAIYFHFQPSLSTTQPTFTAALITPHHLLAHSLIDEVFDQIDPYTVHQVIIVSPDHFVQLTASQSAIIGNINEPLVSLNSSNIAHKPSAFGLEHGISALLPFIEARFEQAQVSPLIISARSSHQDSIFQIGQKLATLTQPAQTLLIISSDFSHESTHQEATKLDKTSLKALTNLNQNNYQSITNDCPNCWPLVLGYLNDAQCKFQALNNKNSTHFGGPNQNVTSYITGFWTCQH